MGEASAVLARSLERIEWTGAGGDSYLAVVVDHRNEVVEEFWGTQQEVLSWITKRSPRLPARYVPMALGASREHAKRKRRRRTAAR
jgi:hypothetical protein